MQLLSTQYIGGSSQIYYNLSAHVLQNLLDILSNILAWPLFNLLKWLIACHGTDSKKITHLYTQVIISIDGQMDCERIGFDLDRLHLSFCNCLCSNF